MVRGRRDQPNPGSGVADLGDPGIDLLSGQLPAFAGLGALSHLDLEFFGIDQIEAGDAEPAGRDLLDGAVLRVAVRHRHVALRVFAAFTGVALAANAVHGDGERLVRFLTDGAVAHGARLEALQDALDRFHLFDGDGLDLLEVQQAPQRAPVPVLLIDQRGVFLESLLAAGAHRRLQFVDGLRIKQVVLPVVAPLVLAAGVKQMAVDGTVRKSVLVPLEDFLGNDLDPHAGNTRGRAREVFVDEDLLQANGLKDLRAPIALDGGNAHLRKHLHHALHRGLEVILAGRLVINARQQPLPDHVVEGLEREVRVDGPTPIADEERVLVDLARRAGFQHQTDAGASAFADQVVMQTGDRKQRRDRRPFLVHAAVREDDYVDAVLDGLADLEAHVVHRFLQAGRPVGYLEQDRSGDGLEPWQVNVLELGEFLVGQDGGLEFDETGVFG